MIKRIAFTLMQVKRLFQLLSLSLLALTACSSKSKKSCREIQVSDKAYTRGLQGSSPIADLTLKNCSKNTELQNVYTNAYSKGVDDFCSFERGVEQADLGLEKEKICFDDESYIKGFTETLEKKCSYELARNDASKKLTSSNSLCRKIRVYNKKYEQELKKKCSYSYGKKLGYLKKSIKTLCLDSPTRKSFETGFKKGLSRFYIEENLRVSNEIRTLSRKRGLLKKQKNTSKLNEEKIKINLKINKIESEILNLQSKLEKNKKFIQ